MFLIFIIKNYDIGELRRDTQSSLVHIALATEGVRYTIKIIPYLILIKKLSLVQKMKKVF